MEQLGKCPLLVGGRQWFPLRIEDPSQIKRYQKTFKQGQILQNILELEPNDYVVHEQYGLSLIHI